MGTDMKESGKMAGLMERDRNSSQNDSC